MRSLEETFVAVCDEYLSSRNGYDIRGEQGLFSFAMIIWLGIQQRLSGYSLRSSLNELASRAVDSGGIGFVLDAQIKRFVPLRYPRITAGLVVLASAF
jgi:hypothetical protein